MRKAITVSMLLLAACSQQAPQQASQPAQAEPAPAPEAAPVGAPVTTIDFKAAGLRGPLPEGIEFPFSFHRLNDNTVKVGTPDQERRVYVEIRQMAPQDAEAAFSALLVEKGFSASGATVVRGVRELGFTRADGARVTVKINPRRPKPKAPDATGTLHMVWRSA